MISLSIDSQKYIESQDCIGCKKCMHGCPMLSLHCDNPKHLIGQLTKQSEFDYQMPYDCMQCGYCKTVCPKNIDLGEMFWHLRRDTINHKNKKVLKDIHAFVVSNHQTLSFSKIFSSAPSQKKSEYLFFPGCALISEKPETVKQLYLFLKQEMPDLSISNRCCAKPTYSMGEFQKFGEYFGKLQSEWKQCRVRKIITLCPNCTKTIREHGQDVEVVSFWQFLEDHPHLLKKIQPSKKVDQQNWIIHDPCPTRDDPCTQQAVRSILEYWNQSYQEFELSRAKTLCCGSGGMANVTSPQIAKTRRALRAKTANDASVLTYCQECVESMRREGNESVHLLEILFEDARQESQMSSSTVQKWRRRFSLNRWIKKLQKKKGRNFNEEK